MRSSEVRSPSTLATNPSAARTRSSAVPVARASYARPAARRARRVARTPPRDRRGLPSLRREGGASSRARGEGGVDERRERDAAATWFLQCRNARHKTEANVRARQTQTEKGWERWTLMEFNPTTRCHRATAPRAWSRIARKRHARLLTPSEAATPPRAWPLAPQTPPPPLRAGGGPGAPRRPPPSAGISRSRNSRRRLHRPRHPLLCRELALPRIHLVQRVRVVHAPVLHHQVVR